MQQGKCTFPQFHDTSLEHVDPLGKVQQTEGDGLLFPEQSAVGDPKDEGVATRPAAPEIAT